VRISEENRKDANVRSREGSFYLPPNPIIGHVEPPPALAVSRLEPFRANHNQHGGTGIERIREHICEISTGIDAPNVLENLLVPEVPPQVIRESAHSKIAVLPSIVDEDATVPATYVFRAHGTLHARHCAMTARES
jgi:hypothetical protein